MSLRFPASPTLTLRMQLVLRLFFAVLLMITIWSVAAWQLSRADQQIQQLVDETLAPVADVGRIQNDYNAVMDTTVHAALTRLPSSVDAALTSIRSYRVDIDKHWALLQASGLGRQHPSLLTLATAHRKVADKAIDDNLALLKAGQFDLAQLTFSNDVQSAVGPLKSDFSNLFTLALAGGQQQAAAEHVGHRRDLIMLLLVLTVSLLLAGWIDVAIIRSLGRRLLQASAVAERIASGVLGRGVEVGRADEIGMLLGTLAAMDDTLTNVVFQVRENASLLTHAATGIAEGNDALSERTQAQAVHLERTTVSMKHMAAGVKESVRHAAAAEAAASTAKLQALQGQEVATKATGSMKEIGRTSRRMTEVLDLVDQVAFQTHLLALNAAVEAASAGVHGRGFAVVAAEIRELARRCGGASRDIRLLIEESARAVETGSGMVVDTGSALCAIGEHVNHLSALVAAMAETGRDHARDIERVNRAVGEMDAMTQENAALVEQAAAASHAMQDNAEMLRRQVGFFRMEQQEPPVECDKGTSASMSEGPVTAAAMI